MIWTVYQLPPGAAPVALRCLGRVRAPSHLAAITRAAQKWPIAADRGREHFGFAVELGRQNLVKTPMRGSA